MMTFHAQNVLMRKSGMYMKRKPELCTRKYLDYSDCSDWISKKLGKDIRDYNKKNEGYQDFWHFVIDMCSPHNGTFFNMYKDWVEDAEEWQREIINAFFVEFKEYIDDDSLEFYVWW